MFATTAFSAAAHLAASAGPDACSIDAIAGEGSASSGSLDPIERLAAALTERNRVMERAVIKGRTSARTQARVDHLAQQCLDLVPVAASVMGIPHSSLSKWVAKGISKRAYEDRFRSNAPVCETAALADGLSRQLWRFTLLLPMYCDDAEGDRH